MLTPEHHRSLLQRIEHLKHSKSEAQRREGLILEERLSDLLSKKKHLQVVPQAQQSAGELQQEQASNRPSTANTQNVVETSGIIEQQLSHIKTQIELLGLRADASVLMPYDLITSEKSRKQLRADNARMENALLDIDTDKEAADGHYFHRFCVYGFFQIEEMLNFYYSTKFPKIKDLKKDFLQRGVSEEYLRNASRVDRISVGSKIIAYQHEFPAENAGRKKTDYVLSNIRELRNMESHRHSAIDQTFAHLSREFNGIKKTIANYEQNGLPPYTKTTQDKEIERKYWAVSFLRDRNPSLVREQLFLMETNIAKQLAS